MPTRVTMNSRALQEAYPDVYRAFFAQNDLVVSAPGSFYWFGDHADRYGELGIKQKVPLRGYVGLQATAGSSWVFGDGLQFIPSDSRYKKFVRHTPRMKRVAELLTNEARRLGLPGNYRISTITEIPVSCGVASWAAIAAAIATALYLQSGRISVEEIERWSATPTNTLTSSGSAFDLILRLAWKIESLHNADASSGSAVFTALVNSTLPMVYTTEKRSGDRTNHPEGRIPTDIGDDYQLLDSIQYWGYRLDEFFSLKTTENWPVDFGLIYSGSASSAEFAIRAAKDVQFELDDLQKEILAISTKNISNRLQGIPSFLERLRRQSPFGLWESRLAALGGISIEGVMAFKQLFDRGYTNRAVQNLFHAIDQYQSHLKIFGVTTPTLRKVKHELVKLAISEETTMAAKVTGTGLGGDILFVTPLYTFEHSIDHLMKTLRDKVDPRAWLDYASWLDGYEERGVVIEQHLSARRLSSFVSGGTSLISSWSDETVFTRTVGVDSLPAVVKKFDLFLDPVERTISIRGSKLTSEELHSSKATIAILGTLLQNIGKEVRGDAFPKTYADRTTMQGKIVGPLCEVFETKTKKPLPLTVRGGLNKRFTLKFDIDGLTIGMVTKKL